MGLESLMPPEAVQYAEELKQEKEQGKKKDVAQILEVLDDDFTLSSWGHTQPLKITKGEDVSFIILKIKSVGVSEITESVRKNAPRPPSTTKVIKKNSQEGRDNGYKQDTLVREINLDDPGYMEKSREHDDKSGQLIMLAGLAYDIEVPKGSGNFILKGADVSVPSEVIDPEAALKWLRKKGITGSHYGQILKDIRNLTEDVDEQEVQE